MYTTRIITHTTHTDITHTNASTPVLLAVGYPVDGEDVSVLGSHPVGLSRVTLRSDHLVLRDSQSEINR